MEKGKSFCWHSGIYRCAVQRSCSYTGINSYHLKYNMLPDSTIENGLSFTGGRHAAAKSSENDITKMNTDAIVNAANSTLLGRGRRRRLHPTGLPALRFWPSVRSWAAVRPETLKSHTPGICPAKYVIHAVGTHMAGRQTTGRRKKLTSCYRTSLFLAKKASLPVPLLFP